MKKALVLAGGPPQIELLQQLKSRGITTVLADGSEMCVARPYADRFVKAPLFDIEAIRDLAVREQVDFIITVCADQVLLVMAQVSEMLGLPCYIDTETAMNVSDKIRMKTILKANGIPTSDFADMTEYDPAKIRSLRYPLVVKPVDAYSSRGVRKATNEEELERYFREAAEISRSRGVIVEEFCPGTEISVDAFIVNGKAKILCVSNSEKVKDADRFVIFRGRYPAEASPAVLREIEEIAQGITDAFGLKNAPLLIQMMNDGKHVRVLEFCARTGGNLKYLLIRYSCGADVIRGAIDLSLGETPVMETRDTGNRIVVNDFVYCRPGVFDRLEGFEKLRREGILTEFHPIRPRGFQIRGVTSSSDRLAGVTICADSMEAFNRKHERFVRETAVLDPDGQDLMRHDLLPPLGPMEADRSL